MEEDPLLPQELLPLGYHGQEVFQLHSEITRLIARALRRDL
jgi:DNA-binding transcriptional regulator PaaX